MQPSPSPANLPPNARRLTATVVVVGVILVLAIAALFIYGWARRQQLNEAAASAIEAMPADSLAVIQLVRTTADLPQLSAIWHTFAAATADFDPPLQTPFQALAQWQQAHHITLAADVLPWLGQTASLSLLSFDEELAMAEWIIAADSVEEAAAADFVAKLLADGLSAAYSGGLVLIGSSETAVQRAIAAQAGESIIDDATYQEAMATLPAEQPLRAYVVGSQVRPIAEAVWAQTAVSTTLPLPQLISNNGLRSLALTITPTAAGLQIDSTTLYEPSQLTATQQAALDIWLAEPKTHQIAPENTLAYLSGQGFNLLWDTYVGALAADPDQADFVEAMQLFGTQFDLDPQRDLFPYLDGETAVFITPSRAGAPAQILRLNLGGTLLAGTSDPNQLAANLAAFTTAVSDPQLAIATVQATAVSDISLHQIETSLFPGISLLYGVGRDAFFLSTSEASLAELNFGNGPALADNPDFQLAQAALPAGRQPTLFVKVADLIEAFRTSGFMLARAREFERETAVLQPITLLAASSTVAENRVQNRIVLFIDRDN